MFWFKTSQIDYLGKTLTAGRLGIFRAMGGKTGCQANGLSVRRDICWAIGMS